MKNLIILLLVIPFFAIGQESQKITYKTIGDTNLQLEIFTPKMASNAQAPVIIFFFGGGWNSGTTDQFRPQAQYFAGRGIVTILADYRVKNKHQASPFESLMDAKSAVRYVRNNAAKWGINLNKIVASGGSAGGHLAAATAVIEKYNDPNDDLSISCVPDALVLFNPVIDNGPGGYGFERIGDAYKNFSPIHNLRNDLPPTIFFLGTNDALIPVETAKYYQTVMQKTGNRCDLHLYEGAGHGFFNPRNPHHYSNTVDKTDQFLQSIGFLDLKGVRQLVDTIGFAQYDWQMDSIVNRLSRRMDEIEDETWKAVIAPHDDFKYAGNKKALALEKEIITQCLTGKMDSKKMKKFTEYTVQKDDYKEYKWT